MTGRECKIDMWYLVGSKRKLLLLSFCHFACAEQSKQGSAAVLLDVLSSCLDHMPKGKARTYIQSQCPKIMASLCLGTDSHLLLNTDFGVTKSFSSVYICPCWYKGTRVKMIFFFLTDCRLHPSPVIDSNIVWVTKWVDYSNKYGFGFQLSNDALGVLFNDTSRILMSPDGRCGNIFFFLLLLHCIFHIGCQRGRQAVNKSISTRTLPAVYCKPLAIHL